MKAFLEPLKDWFGYTRRERRAAGILLILIIIILIIRTFIPDKFTSIEVAGFEYKNNYSQLEGEKVDSFLTYFDPNKASYDKLIKAGFTSVTAKTLISYRNSGGKFYKPEDLKKIYGLSDTDADRLFATVKFENPVNDSLPKKYGKNLIIDINLADSAQLVILRGIGPVLAARIIKYRKLIGGYASKEQLKEVYGLSPETFDLIKGSVKADTTVIRKVKINDSDYKTISSIIYLENYEVSAILKYRELNGRISDVGQLVENRLISREKAIKIRPYLRFD